MNIYKLFATLVIAIPMTSFAAQENSLITSKNKNIVVLNNTLGTGTPVMNNNVIADYIDNGYYHSLQYMPYYPTAGVIWPRVVEVECKSVNNTIICDGYNWTPDLGRGEYLFILPKVKDSNINKEVIKEIHKEVTVIKEPVFIYKEVLPKKIKE